MISELIRRLKSEILDQATRARNFWELSGEDRKQYWEGYVMALKWVLKLIEQLL